MKNKNKLTALLFGIAFASPLKVFGGTGNKIMDSAVGMGVMALLKDLGSWMAIISLALTVVAVIVLFIKKQATEANESGASKNFNKSILVTLGCGIAVFLVGGFLALIGSYFGVAIQV